MEGRSKGGGRGRELLRVGAIGGEMGGRWGEGKGRKEVGSKRH